MHKPLVSVIVPTYNSHDNLKNLLESFLDSSYKNFEIIINDDVRSVDEVESLCKEYRHKGLEVRYFRENKSMAQGRKRGVDFSSGEVLLHLDSDMKISENLLGECIESINSGRDALVIPEESYGTTFWAKCKWLEKKCYDDVEEIQSLRCIKKEVYLKIGGHDDRMVFSEDKDLDIRVRKDGYRVGETKNFLYHNEGDLKLLKTLKKKLNYSDTANLFAQKHPKEFRWQANPINRYIVFLRNIKYLFVHPLLYMGMIFMKTSEFAFAGSGMIFKKIMKNYFKCISLLKVISEIKNPFALRYNSKLFKNKIGKIFLKNGLIFKIRGGESDIKEVIKLNLLNEYPLEFFRDMNPQGIILDMGAHIGSFSLMMNKNFPKTKIFAIEPMADNFNLLLENIGMNKANDSIMPIKNGISNYEGKGFFETFDGMDSSHLNSGNDIRDKSNGEQVDIIRMDTLVKKMNIESIDLMKIDVEGEEYKILPDMADLLEKIRIVVIEYHQIINNKMIYPNGGQNIVQVMTTAGFKVLYRTKNVMIWKRI